MSQITISGGGVFTSGNVSDLNANFTELYTGVPGQTLASPTITGTVAGGATYTAPTLTTPTIGVATATSVNKVILTAPATSATLTLIDGTTVTGPAATGTLVTATGTATLTNKTLDQTDIFSNHKIVAAVTYTSNNTPAVITGLSWTVAASASYIFELNLPTVMTTNGGLTVAFALTTATLASINYQTYAATASDNTTAVSTNGTTTTSGTLVFDSVAAAYTHVNIKGAFQTTLGGTFQWNASQHTSAGGGDVTTLLANGYATMTRVV